MSLTERQHPFDVATQLTRNSETFHGHTSEKYNNMVGPFGGITAATLLRAVIEHPERQGDPVSLTINYAAPVSDGPFTIKANPARTNRSTQHWFIELYQKEKIVITGTAVLASRRHTLSSTEALFPEVPSAADSKRLSTDDMPSWAQNYSIKIIEGLPLQLSQTNTEETADSVTIQWIQDEPRRSMDFLSLTAICDAFFPRIYVRRKEMVPIGTVSLTVYFHADSEMLTHQGDKAVLAHARALQFHDGFFDQTGEIWSPEGKLLATTSQFVYYKA